MQKEEKSEGLLAVRGGRLGYGVWVMVAEVKVTGKPYYRCRRISAVGFF